MTKIPRRKITVSTTPETVSISIPVDILVWSQANRDYPYEINDTKGMLRYIRKNIIGRGFDSDDGSTALERFLDDMFTEAYENAVDWIEEIDYDEDDEEEFIDD